MRCGFNLRAQTFQEMNIWTRTIGSPLLFRQPTRNMILFHKIEDFTKHEILFDLFIIESVVLDNIENMI